MKGFPPIPTWDVLLCLVAFVFLLVLLLPWRPVRTAWRRALLITLNVAMLATVVVGFACAMDWTSPPKPLAEVVQQASALMAELMGFEPASIRPWAVMALTAILLVAQMVVIQLVSFGGQVRSFDRLLRRLITPRDDHRTDDPRTPPTILRAKVPVPVPPADNIETAQRGLRSLLLRRSGPAGGKKSLASWLQA